MANDEQYVPDEQDLEVAWIESEASADDINVAAAEFDRFLARVRRDAAREALDGLAEQYEHDAYIRAYRNAHYPEETP